MVADIPLAFPAAPYFARAACCFVCCEVVYFLGLSVVAPASLSAGDAKTFALKIVNVVHAACIGPCAAYVLAFGVWSGGEGYDGALTAGVRSALALDGAAAPALFSGGLGASAAYALTPFTVGFFAWDLWRVEAWAKSSRGERRLMVAHHVLSIAVWPVAALSGVAGPFLLHFLSTELSSPLLQGRWYAQAFFGRGSAADAAASGLFAVAFFAVRSTNAARPGGTRATHLAFNMLDATFREDRPRASRAPRETTARRNLGPKRRRTFGVFSQVHVVGHSFLRARPFDGALHPAVPGWIRVLGTCTLGLPTCLNAVWTLQILLLGKKMVFGATKRPKAA